MEKKNSLKKLNSDIDLGKVLFTGGFAAGFLSMFGFRKEALVAFAVCMILGLVFQLLNKWVSLVAAGIAFVGVILTMHASAVSGFKLFANSVSQAFGQTYGRNFPLFEDMLKSDDTGCNVAFAVSMGLASLFIFELLTAFAGRGSVLAEVIVILGIASVVKTEITPWMIVMASGAACLAGTKKTGIRTIATAVLVCLLALGVYVGTDSFMADRVVTGTRPAIEKSDQVALSVAMEKPQSMYLKGESLDTYEKGLWKDIAPEVRYENRDLFYWLHEEGFYGQTQLAKAAITDDKSLKKETNKVQIQIKNADAAYKYVPYELTGDADRNAIGDGEISGKQWAYDKSEKTYSYDVLPNQVKSYSKILSAITEQRLRVSDGKEMSKAWKKYLNEESYYNSYIYKNYLDITEEQRGLFEGILGKYKLDGKSHYDYLKAKENIVEYFASHITYDEETQYEGDFVDAFLSESCKGYSAQYASCGVLMMRYYGIPARLASGYLVTPRDAKLMESGAFYDVTEDSRHYWVEYYQDGVGWIPFEVTTPYIGLMESENHLAAVSQETKEQEEEKHEIKQDNYQKPDPQKKKEVKKPWLTAEIIAIILCIAVIMLLVFLLLVYMLRRRKIMEQRTNMGIGNQDLSRRTVGEYMLLLEIMDRYKGASAAGDETKNSGSDLREAYPVYQKARYSEKGISAAEYDAFSQIAEPWKLELYQSIGKLKQIIWKCWYFY